MNTARLAIVLCTLLAAVPCRPQDRDFEKIARDYERSIVRITAEGQPNVGNHLKETGTGFVVAQGGYVLTAAHVIEPAGGWDREAGTVFLSFYALDSDGGLTKIPGDAVVLYRDEQTDLALLRLHGFNRPPLQLGNSTYLEDGQFIGVMAFGEDRTRPWPGEGSIETVFRTDVRGFMDLVLANVGKSDSGSPLLDRQGRVVGVLLKGWENLPGSVEVFGVPVNSAAPLLAMAGRNHPATLIQWMNETPEFDRKIAELEQAIVELRTSWTYELDPLKYTDGELGIQIVLRKRLAHGYWPEKVSVSIVPILAIDKYQERSLGPPIEDEQTFSRYDTQVTQVMVVNNLAAEVRKAAEKQHIDYERIARFVVEISSELKLDDQPEPIRRNETINVYP